MLRPGKLLLLVASLALLLFLVACNPEATNSATPAAGGGGEKVHDGDTVTVNYRGTLDSGEEFDTSFGREPLTFVVGSGGIIKGFDNAVKNLATGETTKVRLTPEDAYGQRDDQLIFEVPRAQAPDGLKAGDQVQLSNGAPATIMEVSDQIVKVDANHPLAGQALTFEIEVVDIKR